MCATPCANEILKLTAKRTLEGYKSNLNSLIPSSFAVSPLCSRFHLYMCTTTVGFITFGVMQFKPGFYLQLHELSERVYFIVIE